MKNQRRIEENLLYLLDEIGSQPDVGRTFPEDVVCYEEQLAQLREYIEDAHEYGIAYESMVAMLESRDFKLSGQSAVKLLEIGLLFGFKTERSEDAAFDRRVA